MRDDDTLGKTNDFLMWLDEEFFVLLSSFDEERNESHFFHLCNYQITF